MKKLLIAAAVVIAMLAPATGADKPKVDRPPGSLTNLQALTVLAGLKGLDGHQIVVKQNGQDIVVTIPWEFKNTVLRQTIIDDEIMLSSLEQTRDKMIQQIRGEVFKDRMPKDLGGGRTDMDDTAESREFQKQWQEWLDQPAFGTENLKKIKFSDLRMDMNEIPASIGVALAPIRGD